MVALGLVRSCLSESWLGGTESINSGNSRCTMTIQGPCGTLYGSGLSLLHRMHASLAYRELVSAPRITIGRARHVREGRGRKHALGIEYATEAARRLKMAYSHSLACHSESPCHSLTAILSAADRVRRRLCMLS
jgi:hypothetical protein